MAIRIILLLIALIINSYAPNKIDYPIIYLSSLIYVVDAFILLKDDIRKRHFISFNMLFSFAFFLCTYAYSLFVLGTPFEDLGMWATKYINFNFVTHGLTLSTVGYCTYTAVYGLKRFHTKPASVSSCEEGSIYNFRPILIILSILLLVNFVLYVRANPYSANVSVSPYISILFIVFLCLSIMARQSKEHTKSFSGFLSLYRIETFICVFFIILYLYIGDRGLPIKLLLILMYAYSRYFKEIPLRRIAIVVVAGAIVMYGLRLTRHSDSSIRNSGLSSAIENVQSTFDLSAPILVFSDLLGANFEMCTSLEYVNANGYYNPSQVVLLPFMPIPILPSIISEKMYGKQVTAVMASSVLNEFMEDANNYTAHFGNHVITDLYMRWGILGLIIGFSLLGFIVAKIEDNESSSLYYGTLYLILISTSIYLSRDSIINYIRYFSWTYFVILLYRKHYRI